MSYCTPEYAKALLGTEIPQELLDEAQQLIHSVTEYRWEATTVTETFSSKDIGMPISTDIIDITNDVSIFLKMPIQEISSFVVDGEDMEEGIDYEVRKDIGEVRLITSISTGGTSISGTGDIEITYTYGYGSDHKYFKLVQGIEARIALLLKNNPLMLAEIDLQGDKTNYSGVLDALLKNVPKLPRMGVLGK